MVPLGESVTKDRDFKDLVRARQRRTGESYVEARRQTRLHLKEPVRPPRLRASFPRKAEPHRWVATLEWDDGLAGEMAVLLRGKQLRMPHDLEHYVVDAVLGHEYAFWPLLARYGAFKSVRLTRGTWGRERLREFAAVLAEHRDQIEEAETPTAPIRTIVHHNLTGADAVRAFASSPAKNAFERLTSADVEALVERYRRMELEWLEGDADDPLVVIWPPG